MFSMSLEGLRELRGGKHGGILEQHLQLDQLLRQYLCDAIQPWLPLISVGGGWFFFQKSKPTCGNFCLLTPMQNG